MFQSTRPHGARPDRVGLVSRRCCFNPRARMGRDQIWSENPANKKVSIHAPAWGATWVGIMKRRGVSVSIHAPAWGATATTNSTATPNKTDRILFSLRPLLSPPLPTCHANPKLPIPACFSIANLTGMFCALRLAPTSDRLQYQWIFNILNRRRTVMLYPPLPVRSQEIESQTILFSVVE